MFQQRHTRPLGEELSIIVWPLQSGLASGKRCRSARRTTRARVHGCSTRGAEREVTDAVKLEAEHDGGSYNIKRRKRLPTLEKVMQNGLTDGKTLLQNETTDVSELVQNKLKNTSNMMQNKLTDG